MYAKDNHLKKTLSKKVKYRELQWVNPNDASFVPENSALKIAMRFKII